MFHTHKILLYTCNIKIQVKYITQGVRQSSISKGCLKLLLRFQTTILCYVRTESDGPRSVVRDLRSPFCQRYRCLLWTNHRRPNCRQKFEDLWSPHSPFWRGPLRTVLLSALRASIGTAIDIAESNKEGFQYLQTGFFKFTSWSNACVGLHQGRESK